MKAVGSGLNIAGAALHLRRDEARDRRCLILATPELRERELLKFASLAATVATGMREAARKLS